MTTLFALPGGPEMLVIFFAIVLLFGGKGIPKLMKGLGQGIGEFKKARKEEVRVDGYKIVIPRDSFKVFGPLPPPYYAPSNRTRLYIDGEDITCDTPMPISRVGKTFTAKGK